MNEIRRHLEKDKLMVTSYSTSDNFGKIFEKKTDRKQIDVKQQT